MPFGDGTGPRGMGPMTGRGAGYCAGFGQPGFANPIMGRGRFGFGLARRNLYGYPYAGGYGVAAAYMGYGYPYYGAGPAVPGAVPFSPPMTREQELDFLRNQAQAMRGQLEQIQSRIQQLGSEV